jgi:predicted type IV restriction endonuclease
MPIVPNRVAERLVSGLKTFQPIMQTARVRDVNESDTVIIVTDMLSYVFGYDKYSEITSEFSVKNTYCDLATKIDGEVQCLIEVKAAGLELKEAHTKQAVDYAANQGIDWVVLTNGCIWKVYRVNFSKPVTQDLVVEIDFLALSHKREQDIQALYLLAKEGFQKSALGDYSAQRQALSRFCIAATILSDPVVEVVRRELRRLSPDVKIDSEQIRNVLTQEVLKRDVLEGDKAEDAKKRIAKAANKVLRARAAAATSDTVSDVPQADSIIASGSDGS